MHSVPGMALALLLLVLLLPVEGAVAAESPGLGRAMAGHELAAASFTVLPDGTGLPAGTGTAAQGEVFYQRLCRSCHGESGLGGGNDALAGGQGTLNTQKPVPTVGSYWPYATTVFDYIRRAMPYNAPGSLSADQVYALTAYLLHINKIIGREDKLDRRSLPLIEMPNRQGFIWSVNGET